MKVVEEQFLMTGVRATSVAGVAASTVATLLWFYRFTFDHRFSWDLLAVPLTMIAVKWSLLLYYRQTD